MKSRCLSHFVVLFSLLLAACTPAATPAPTLAPTAPPARVTLTLAAGAVGKELEITRAQAERFMERYPNIEVLVLDTPDLAQDRLGVYLQFLNAQSPGVDVYEIDVIWTGDLAEHFVDLYEYGAADIAPLHFPASIENNTVDGRLVAVPWFLDAGLLYYRTDLLQKYGFTTPPKTWDELTNMAQTIQDGERASGNTALWGFVWQGDAYEGLTCDALEWIYSNGGGTIIDRDKNVTINNANAIAAIERAASWVGSISPPGVTAFYEEDARAAFGSGNAVFMRNWPYAYPIYKADDASPVQNNFDVAPLPAGDSGKGAATLGGWQVAVSKYSRHPQEAALLALFLASPEEQKFRAIEGAYNPTVMSLYEDAEVLAANPFFGSLYDVFINTVARPSTASAPRYNDVSTLFFESVHSVLTGEQQAAPAMQKLEQDLKNLLGK